MVLGLEPYGAKRVLPPKEGNKEGNVANVQRAAGYLALRNHGGAPGDGGGGLAGAKGRAPRGRG